MIFDFEQINVTQHDARYVRQEELNWSQKLRSVFAQLREMVESQIRRQSNWKQTCGSVSKFVVLRIRVSALPWLPIWIPFFCGLVWHFEESAWDHVAAESLPSALLSHVAWFPSTTRPLFYVVEVNVPDFCVFRVRFIFFTVALIWFVFGTKLAFCVGNGFHCS